MRLRIKIICFKVLLAASAICVSILVQGAELAGEYQRVIDELHKAQENRRAMEDRWVQITNRHASVEKEYQECTGENPQFELADRDRERLDAKRKEIEIHRLDIEKSRKVLETFNSAIDDRRKAIETKHDKTNRQTNSTYINDFRSDVVQPYWLYISGINDLIGLYGKYETAMEGYWATYYKIIAQCREGNTRVTSEQVQEYIDTYLNDLGLFADAVRTVLKNVIGLASALAF